ncbi:Flagellar hook protein flgE [Chromobacterium violaceum]|uniref:Flagellar hook protein FlgE n=1 Tax=Chromobacterium violaceum TaxID=536 RepID=A0A3S4IHL1_CHRVL|nr:Flagellar hook protein flgE [Chromobacterium violaceum]
MGFQQGLSGINAASVQLDSIGNNVANANTVGFKSSRTEFGDLYAQSIFGTAANSPGNGVSVLAVTANMSAGNTENTGRSLDLAINNNGFFIMNQPNGTQTYSRDGQFQVNSQGYLVNSYGAYLQGYGSTLPASRRSARCRISRSPTLPFPAGHFANLVAGATELQCHGAGQLAGESHRSDHLQLAEHDGGLRQLGQLPPGDALLFAGLHQRHRQYLDGHALRGRRARDDPGGGSGNTNFSVKFNNNGSLANTTPANVNLTFNTTNGSSTPQTVALNLTGSNQIAQNYGTGTITQNGSAPGLLTGVSIASNGVVQATFSNSQTKTLGQVALATFVNPQGLLNLGGNQWQQSGNSGPATVNQPGTGNAGTLTAGSVEDSNVNLTNELVNMITAQRYYQANAQTIKTQDTLIQTLLNI